ncbi:MAG: hypothetical protein SCM96_12830 [Acidobacteriota bacterium]|nr:hypothetical protein [Acidobacteriota bacterium]
MSKKIETQHGVVAFLDILGYANFLENNEPEVAAQTVLDFLTTVPKRTIDTLLDILSTKSTRKEIEQQLGDLKWLVFSDSILLTCPYPNDADPKQKSLSWLMSFFSLIITCRHLLDSGLPVRGGVSCGKFFVKEYCFAGRCIVAAHALASSLDLAAVALDDSAKKELDNLKARKYFNIIGKITIPYLVPLKGGASVKRIVLPPSFPQIRFDNPDLRQVVAESFWRHNKDVPPSVLGKLYNTEMFLRFMKTQFPKMFESKAKQPNKAIDSNEE